MLDRRKLLLGSIVIVVLAVGWRFPLLGLVVPVVVMTGLITSFFKGRFFCGNGCPRGAFLDSLPIPDKRWRSVPKILKNPFFRWTVVVLLFSVMIGRGLQDPGLAAHWGLVFWQMCLVTTAIALILALTYRPRAWCAMCPVGTLQRALGRGRQPLTIGPQCKGCRLCERVCPLELSIADCKPVGHIVSADCLKCGRCQAICPVKAINRTAARQLKN